MPLRNLNIIVITAVLSFACYQKAQHNRYATSVVDAMRLVERYYVEDVESRQLFENAMNGMVTGLDRYSSYIDPDSFKRMEEDLDQEFGGVGIEIDRRDDGSPLMVLSPLVGTPAYRAGMRAGDVILEIEGVSTAGMSRPESVDRMRGRPGLPVRLLVRHAGESDPVEMNIIREVILVQSVKGDIRRADGSWEFHLQENPRIAYLRLTTFGKHSVEELKKVLEDEQANPPYEALILDLRGNAGGLLNSAVETCDAFVNKGLIVSTRGRDGRIRSKHAAKAPTIVPLEMPMAVLVNGFSASASEIVAACLQDHKRAVVIGERTWGKGTVQNILELEGGRSALKLTTASYWRPSGKNIHRRGDAGEDEPWGVRPSDGFEVRMTVEESTRAVWEREKRDLYPGLVADYPDLVPTLLERFRATVRARETRSSDKSETEVPVQETELAPSTADFDETVPFDDPQLRKAIDHLEEKLEQVDARARTA